jgi:hypothetical protein
VGFRPPGRRPSPTVRADVVVLDERGKPVELYDAKYDAKYKVTGETPSADDIYQLVTYCERLGLREATLVRPGAGEPTEISIGGCLIRAVRLCVDDLPSQVAMSTKRE